MSDRARARAQELYHRMLLERSLNAVLAAAGMPDQRLFEPTEERRDLDAKSALENWSA